MIEQRSSVFQIQQYNLKKNIGRMTYIRDAIYKSMCQNICSRLEKLYGVLIIIGSLWNYTVEAHIVV